MTRKCLTCENKITPENIIPSKYIQNMLLELINNKEKEDCPPQQQSTTKSETTLRVIFYNK